MAFDKSTVRELMRARLSTVSGLPTYIKYENRMFQTPNPSTGTLWIRERIFTNSERKTTPAMIEARGETHFDVFSPTGFGSDSAEVLQKAIAEAFEAGKSITDGTLGIQLERTERRNLSRDPEYDNWTYLPVVIRWRVFTATTA